MKISVAASGAVSGATRVWLRTEGLVVLALSVLLYWNFGARWWLFAALLLVPDLSMLGYVVGRRVGRLSYNIVHSYVLPLGVAIAAIATHSVRLLPLICIWTAHIGLDRLLGYGLKVSDRFGDTHLGKLGKRQEISLT
ncbi:MAG: DUF4260 domain-containing protein [Acidobacteriaceae bacterium]|jgi:hypothetical protein